jgi:hypothetical protein
MKSLPKSFLALTLLALVGCASITGSKNQPISITPVCEGVVVSNASCTLMNDKGTWYVQTPGSVMIQKAYGDLSVTCKKETAVGTGAFQSKSNGGVWGNVLAGGIIGYAVDASSGAGFDYPPTMTVVLSPPCPNNPK